MTYTAVGAGGANGFTTSGSGDINDTVNIPSGSSITYTVTGTVGVSASGTLSNTATVSAPGTFTDTNAANNSATDSDTMTPLTDVSVMKTDGFINAPAGGFTTYTIVVSNSGPSTAVATALTDTFPAPVTGATWTSVATAGASGNTASGSGNIAESLTLVPGSTVTYTVVANLNAASIGLLTNTATVSQANDTNNANDSATDTDNLITPKKVFNLPSSGDNTVVLEKVPGGTMLKLTVTTVGHAPVVTIFEGQFLQSITINGSFRNEKITVKDLGSYAAELVVNGGDGNDMIDTSGFIHDATLTGGGGNDKVTAGPGNDSVFGGAGNDMLSGGNGKDTLSGDDGNDVVNGGNGDDQLSGGAGTDCVFETSGTSTVTLTNTTLTGLGNDKLTSIECFEVFGNDANNFFDASKFTLGGVHLHGGGGNDTLLGTPFSDVLDGGDGNDTIRQTSANNQAVNNNTASGAGTDSLMSIESVSLNNSGSTGRLLDSTGFSGSVTLNGGTGNDTLVAGSGSSSLNGGAGNDSITGGSGFDAIDGGAGNDTVDGGDGNDIIKGGDGNDLLKGGLGDDRIFGDAGNDRVFGGNGQDLIDGGAGNDTLLGEAGHDSIYGGAGNDALRGGDGDDILSGDAGNDTMLGDAGNDTLRSNGGSDKIIAGTGADRIEASNAVINTGDGDDTVIGSGNTINEAFSFNFDALLT